MSGLLPEHFCALRAEANRLKLKSKQVFTYLHDNSYIVIGNWLSIVCTVRLKQVELLKLNLSIFLQYLQRNIYLRIGGCLKYIFFFRLDFTYK